MTYQPRHRAWRPPSTPVLSRRHLLGATGLTVATLGYTPVLAQSAEASTGSAPFLPYTTTSYFRSPASGLAQDAARTSAFRTFMQTHPDQRGYAYPRIKGIGGNQWGTAYAMSTAADPIWKLTGPLPSVYSVLQTTGFHAPDWLSAVFSGTTDSPFCVVDLGSGFTVFGTKASVVGPRTLSVSSAGITYHSSNGLHRKNPQSNDNRNSTGRGRISDAMVIRSDLVKHGIANGTDLGHVLALFLVETSTADGYQSPMIACESGKAGFGAEGERILIDPSIDLTRRGLSPGGLVVARTLQRYGCYFGDNAGKESALKAEQETSSHPVWSGLLNQDSLAGITWDDFVVLRPV